MILPTILSRTQRMNVRKIDEASIDRVLQTKYNILPADSISIAHLANGNFIKALETIHLNEENQLFFDLFVSLMRLSYQRKIKEMKMWSEQVAGMGRERKIVHKIDFLQRIVHLDTYGGSCRTYVLEGSGGGQSGCFFQFFY